MQNETSLFLYMRNNLHSEKSAVFESLNAILNDDSVVLNILETDNQDCIFELKAKAGKELNSIKAKLFSLQHLDALNNIKFENEIPLHKKFLGNKLDFIFDNDKDSLENKISFIKNKDLSLIKYSEFSNVSIEEYVKNMTSGISSGFNISLDRAEAVAYNIYQKTKRMAASQDYNLKEAFNDENSINMAVLDIISYHDLGVLRNKDDVAAFSSRNDLSSLAKNESDRTINENKLNSASDYIRYLMLNTLNYHGIKKLNELEGKQSFEFEDNGTTLRHKPKVKNTV